MTLSTITQPFRDFFVPEVEYFKKLWDDHGVFGFFWHIWQPLCWLWPSFEIVFIYWWVTLATPYRAFMYGAFNIPDPPFTYFFIWFFDLPYLTGGAWPISGWIFTITTFLILMFFAWRSVIKNPANITAKVAWWFLYTAVVGMCFSLWGV